MWALIAGWGAVPKTLVWDNEGAIGSWKSGRPQLTGPTQAFRGTLGITVRLCRPADPEAKGLVERANGYLETSFLPGRSFTDPGDRDAAALLRRARRLAAVAVAETEVQQRNLADYDRISGTDLAGVEAVA